MASLTDNVERITKNVADTYSVLNDMGATMPTAQNSDNLPKTASTIKAVRYDAQTLTDEQKAQVRSNIGVPDVITVTVDDGWNTSHSAAEIINAKNAGTIVILNCGVILVEVATAGPDSTDYVDFYTILGADTQLMKLRVRIAGNKATPTFVNIDAASVGMSTLIVEITRGDDGTYTASHSSREIHTTVEDGRNVYANWNGTYYPCTNCSADYVEFAMPYVGDGFVYSYFAISGSEVSVHEETAGSFDEEQLDNIVLITVEDIDEICNPKPEEPDEPDEPDVPANTFQKVRALQDGKEYILLFGYNGAYYCLGNEAFNDWTVKAAAVTEVTSTDAQITFTTVPVLFTARASGSGFTLHNGSNNLYGEASSHGTALRVSTESGIVFTVDTSAMGGFDSDEIVPKVDDQAVWLRSSFEAGNTCLKFESANTSIGLDYKDRDATYSTGFLSFVLYEKIS